jgi:hypothetical protein
MRNEVQKSTPLPDKSQLLLSLEFLVKQTPRIIKQIALTNKLQQELYITPFLKAELVYRKLGRIYSILQRLERDTSNHFTKSLLNSVVPQLEVYIKALNIDETKGDDLSQIVTLIRGVILRSKGEYFKPNPKPKKTPVGWG